jgi:hypothetical protein
MEVDSEEEEGTIEWTEARSEEPKATGEGATPAVTDGSASSSDADAKRPTTLRKDGGAGGGSAEKTCG